MNYFPPSLEKELSKQMNAHQRRIIDADKAQRDAFSIRPRACEAVLEV